MNKKSLPNWCQFTGDKSKKSKKIKLPEAPEWREKGKSTNTYIPLSEKEVKMVNAALLLRRPLLITGKPGSGKSSLAEAVRRELELGEKVLHWRITTQSKFTDGLYSYDAISRLQDVQLQGSDSGIKTNIEKYLHLEALGIAFASKTQHVVLIDEIDKSHIDLPNNLLHLFEENEFEIPELKRLEDKGFMPFNDENSFTTIENGLVKCEISTFPLIIMTSNGERDFPPAFMRRCLHLDMDLPNDKQLAEIVHSHFDDISKINAEKLTDIISKFVALRDDGKHYLSTDQLLNAIYLLQEQSIDITSEEHKDIIDSVWHNLFS